MPLDLGADLRVFLSSKPPRVINIPVLEISHSALSKRWFLWSQTKAGRITLESGDVVDVLCLNMSISLDSSKRNLDQVFRIGLDTTDHTDELREELDRIPFETTEFVALTYREYLSSNFSAPQVSVPLQVESLSCKLGTAGLMAASPRLNITRTGENYSPADVPMLRAFL